MTETLAMVRRCAMTKTLAVNSSITMAKTLDRDMSERHYKDPGQGQ
jgi:hypothetical protein